MPPPASQPPPPPPPEPPQPPRSGRLLTQRASRPPAESVSLTVTKVQQQPPSRPSVTVVSTALRAQQDLEAGSPSTATLSPRSSSNPPPAPAPFLAKKTALKAPRQLKGDQSHGNDQPLASSPVETMPPSPRRRRRTPIWLIAINRLLVYGIFVGLAYLGVEQLRETQVHGVIHAPGFKLPNELFLVTDFTTDLRVLQQEFSLARQPFLDEVQSRERTLFQVRADLSAIEERQRLLQQEITSTRAETKSLVDQVQREIDVLWAQSAAEAEQTYKTRLEAFREAILQRVKTLGLTYADNPDFPTPEAWVNAFRLALYSTPPHVKTGDERKWAEEQLAGWRAFLKSQEEAQAEVRKRADTLRKSLAPRIQEIDERVKRLERRIAEAQQEALPVRSEMELLAGQLEEAQRRLTEQTTRYSTQLYQIPQRNILHRLPLSPDGRWSQRRLDQANEFPAGDYLLWILLEKEGQQHWALVPYSVTPATRTEILITSQAAIPASQILPLATPKSPQ